MLIGGRTICLDGSSCVTCAGVCAVFPKSDASSSDHGFFTTTSESAFLLVLTRQTFEVFKTSKV